MGRHLKIYPRKLLALAVASCFAGELAYANPTGPAVTRGQASFATQGNTLTVTNTPGTIINWQGFSIPSQDITRFLQQSASSAVLNRVTGATPSTILGQLQSNGRVYLINPNGITIGKGAVIDVAGLVASSLNLSDADFVAGRHRFTETPGAGAVVNQGTIKTPSGGMVYLVGQNIENHGIIKSPQGEIVLAAGKSVELVDAGTPEIRVQITAPDNQALNLGQLLASGGRIGMYGGLVRQGGVANANTAVVGENGKIVFKAIKDVTLDAGSATTASGPSGGSITVQAETGTLLASGTIEAIGDAGKGGTVQLLGMQVGLTGNVSVDASGQTGGGTVLVGGDFQGKNPEVQNAFRTYFGPDAAIKADAITSGDGGKVIVWSDDVTRAYGSISARGGTQSGNGGFVEVSGKNNLDFAAPVNTSASNGQAGTLLLDPQDIIVSDTTTTDNNQLNVNVPTAGNPAGSLFFADGGGSSFTISDEALEAQTGNIVLQATRDITVNTGLSGGLNLVNQGTSERVVFQAGRHITIGSPLTTNGAAIILEADSPHAGATNRIGQITVAAAASVTSNGGSITLIAGGNATGSAATSDAVANNSGFRPVGIVDAGAGGINLALSRSTDELGIGVTGTITQILGNGATTPGFGSISNLRTTGPMVIGKATTAGTDGLGAGAQTLTVNRISNTYNNSYIALTPIVAGTFELVAGSGGILLDQPLTTYQPTIITTPGTLTISDPIFTSGYSLSLPANVTMTANGSINTGGGSCSGTGCPVTDIFWDGGAGTLNWFDNLNWSTNTLPGLSNNVTIDSGAGAILISSAGALAKSLIANRSLTISGSGSLQLANASQITGLFTLSGGTLGGAGSAAVTGTGGSLVWSGGTMASGGTFLLGGGNSGTLSNSLTLNRIFENQGSLTLSGANIGGSGSIVNSGLITSTNGTSNTINTSLANVIIPTVGAIQLSGAGTTLTATNFPVNDGQIVVGNGATFSTGVAALANSTSSSVVVDAGNYSTGGSSVTTDASGNLAVNGALNAGAITLLAGGTGGVTLNSGSTVTATGNAVDSIVISGASFTNNAGSAVLNPGSGRWLVYSTSPAGSFENGLTGAADPSMPRLYGQSYPVAIAEPGNHLVYSAQPTLTATADDKAKSYGGIDPALTYSLAGFINDDGVLDTTITAGLSGAATLSTAIGAAATAGTHAISSSQGSLASGAGYSIATANGTLTVAKAALTVSADDKSKTYGGADPALTYTANPGQLFYTDTAVVVSGVGLSTNTGAAATAGTHTITASGGTAANYTINTANGTLTVDQAIVSLAGNRAYDGSTSFGPGAFGMINGVNGETLTVASGTGTVASPKVLAGTQSLALGDLALGNGTGLASNYRIAANNNTGTITATTAVPFAWDVSSATDLRWENPANWNQGAVPLNGAMANIGGGLGGPVVYSSASGATSLKTLSSGSGFTLTGGTLTLGNSPADVSTFSGRPLTLNGGTLNGTGTISLAGTTLDVYSGGLLGGSRTILGNVNNFEGTVSPGASPGIMTIDGNYYQGPLGTLLAEIGGPVAGAQYDQLIVTGTVTLGGVLNVALVNGFTPATNDAFTIVQNSAISGTFASEISAPALVTNYLASGVTLTNSASIPDSVLNTQFNQMNNATPDSTGALNVETTINAETGEREIVDSATAVNAKPTIKAGLCR